MKGELVGPFEYTGCDVTGGRVAGWWYWYTQVHSLPVRLWALANGTAGVTMVVYGLTHPTWPAWAAVGVVAVAVELVNLGVLAVAKPVQWRLSTAGRLGGCSECGELWARRADFVWAHRQNERKAVRWWDLKRLPAFCPHCMHDL